MDRSFFPRIILLFPYEEIIVPLNDDIERSKLYGTPAKNKDKKSWTFNMFKYKMYKT